MSAFTITPTPNPNSIRVGLQQTLSASPQTFKTAEEAASEPLAKDLMGVAGVTQVFMMANFITINKDASAEWPALEPEVAKVLEKHLS